MWAAFTSFTAIPNCLSVSMTVFDSFFLIKPLSTWRATICKTKAKELMFLVQCNPTFLIMLAYFNVKSKWNYWVRIIAVEPKLLWVASPDSRITTRTTRVFLPCITTLIKMIHQGNTFFSYYKCKLLPMPFTKLTNLTAWQSFIAQSY